MQSSIENLVTGRLSQPSCNFPRLRFLRLSLPERVVAIDIRPGATVGRTLAFVRATATDTPELASAANVSPRPLESSRAILLRLHCTFVANDSGVAGLEDARA